MNKVLLLGAMASLLSLTALTASASEFGVVPPNQIEKKHVGIRGSEEYADQVAEATTSYIDKTEYEAKHLPVSDLAAIHKKELELLKAAKEEQRPTQWGD